MIKPKKIISNIFRPGPDKMDRKELMRFERNERTTLFSKNTFDAILNTITPYDLTPYASLEPFYLLVSEWLSIDRNQLLLTHGSEQAIKAVFETYVNKGDEIINFNPNFAMYSVYSKMFGACEIVKSYNKSFNIELDDILLSINKKTKLIAISNPGHNGILIKIDLLKQILSHAKKNNILVIIDEAYIEFSGPSLVSEIQEHENLIIIRTMSKAFGLASLRIGFLISSSSIINELYKVKPVHEISGLSAKIGTFLINNESIKDKYLKSVLEGKKVLLDFFNERNIKCIRTDANFMFFKPNSNIDVDKIHESLDSANILIKSQFNVEPFKGYLRITIGDKLQMEKFCSSLDLIIKKNKV